MEEFSGFVLLLLAAILALNIAQGTTGAWLKAKFLGQPPILR